MHQLNPTHTGGRIGGLGVLVFASLVCCCAAPGATAQPQAPCHEERVLPAEILALPHVPAFEVRDTAFKYGPYDPATKAITVDDLVRFHGHLCGGLAEAAVALRAALSVLYRDGLVDRTDLRIVSNNSACGGDVASFLTGARARFGSHHIDLSMRGGEFLVQQVSTGRTVRVVRRPATYPDAVKLQMRRIENGEPTPELLAEYQRLQLQYVRRLFSSPPEALFETSVVEPLSWPVPQCRNLGERHDNDYKHVAPAQPNEAKP